MKDIKNEAVDVSSVIQGMQGNFGGDNESQMKGLQLLKGLATSDDPKANQFMKALNTATTKISKDVLGDKSESTYVESTTVKDNIKEAESKTAKCPDCGGKYLVQTGYCVSCKKKVGGKKKESNMSDPIKTIYSLQHKIFLSGNQKAQRTWGEYSDEVLMNAGEWEDIDDYLVLSAIDYARSIMRSNNISESSIITVDEDVKIGDMILEKGDILKIIEDEQDD